MPETKPENSTLPISQTDCAKCIYDRKNGSYKDQRPAVEPSKPHSNIQAPFKLGG